MSGKYGKLNSNSKARGRRDKVKFFDSADWAMKNQDQNQDDQQAPPQNAIPPPFSQIAGKGAEEGESPLAQPDSPTDNNESPLGQPVSDGESPLAMGEDSPLAG